MDTLNPDYSGEQLDTTTGELRPGPARPAQETALIAAGVVLPKLIRPGTIDWTELEKFVAQLVHDSERTLNSWCTQWWRHPEAILVFHGLHQSFNAKYKEDFNSWVEHDYLPQISYLGSKEGPFSACEPTAHLYKNAKGDNDAAWLPVRQTTLVELPDAVS